MTQTFVGRFRNGAKAVFTFDFDAIRKSNATAEKCGDHAPHYLSPSDCTFELTPLHRGTWRKVLDDYNTWASGIYQQVATDTGVTIAVVMLGKGGTNGIRIFKPQEAGK